jgi:hypothetical protein
MPVSVALAVVPLGPFSVQLTERPAGMGNAYGRVDLAPAQINGGGRRNSARNALGCGRLRV